jgi:hypothetical protein
MNYDVLQTAIAEAERFVERARLLSALYRKNLKQPPATPLIYDYPREQGMVRRASMDLTRALADLRNR